MVAHSITRSESPDLHPIIALSPYDPSPPPPSQIHHRRALPIPQAQSSVRQIGHQRLQSRVRASTVFVSMVVSAPLRYAHAPYASPLPPGSPRDQTSDQHLQ